MRKHCFASAFLFLLFAFSSSPTLANNAPSYIEKFKDIAIREMYRSGIPASITIAQAIHESGWGNGTLATESNNYFGIKCKDYWVGPTYYIEDDDLDQNGKLIKSCFRAYEKIEDSFVDHSDFLKDNPRYKKLFQLAITDYRSWAEGLQKCGYATDVKYAQKLITNIEKYQLYQYDTTPKPLAPAPSIAITKPTKPSPSPAAAPRFNIDTYTPNAPRPSTPDPIVETPVISNTPVYNFEEETYEIPSAYTIPNDYVRGANRTEVETINLNLVETTIVIEEMQEEEPVVEMKEEEEAKVEEYSIPKPRNEAPIPVSKPAPVISSPIVKDIKSEAIIRMTYTENKKTTQLSRQPRVNNSRRR